jgi:hypothetical protein
MGLDGRDIGFLRARPRLVEYLAEAAFPCEHLTIYLGIAKKTLTMAQEIDKLAGVSLLANNETYRVTQIANSILEVDTSVQPMIEAKGWGGELDRILHVYGRMVVGHENDGEVTLDIPIR